MTWQIAANGLVFAGLACQLVGLGWAWVAVLMSWTRRWPGERVLPDCFRRLAWWKRGSDKVPPGFVASSRGTANFTLADTPADQSLEEKVRLLTERVASTGDRLRQAEQRIGQLERTHSRARAEDFKRADLRDREHARASLIGAPILIIIGTALQIAGPIYGWTG